MSIASTHITSRLIDPNARSVTHATRTSQIAEASFRNRSTASLPITTHSEQTNTATEGVPVEEFGWTRSDALRLRAELSSWAELWDDEDLDVYNEFLKR